MLMTIAAIAMNKFTLTLGNFLFIGSPDTEFMYKKAGEKDISKETREILGLFWEELNAEALRRGVKKLKVSTSLDLDVQIKDFVLD